MKHLWIILSLVSVSCHAQWAYPEENQRLYDALNYGSGYYIKSVLHQTTHEVPMGWFAYSSVTGDNLRLNAFDIIDIWNIWLKWGLTEYSIYSHLRTNGLEDDEVLALLNFIFKNENAIEPRCSLIKPFKEHEDVKLNFRRITITLNSRCKTKAEWAAAHNASIGYIYIDKMADHIQVHNTFVLLHELGFKPDDVIRDYQWADWLDYNVQRRKIDMVMYLLDTFPDKFIHFDWNTHGIMLSIFSLAHTEYYGFIEEYYGLPCWLIQLFGLSHKSRYFNFISKYVLPRMNRSGLEEINKTGKIYGVQVKEGLLNVVREYLAVK